MRYKEFEKIMSAQRMARYLTACRNDTRRAMTLYRRNLWLSQELFTIISCFEVALRNAINRHYLHTLGTDWLRDAAMPGGIFDNRSCLHSSKTIHEELRKLGTGYTHGRLVASLGFGFWRYLFAPHQYKHAGKSLLSVFPAKPRSTASVQYNQKFVFNQLASLNEVRNRIAHHEPICFRPSLPIKDTTYARQHYGLILQLFQWMIIDEAALLYGLDHINRVCEEIDAI